MILESSLDDAHFTVLQTFYTYAVYPNLYVNIHMNVELPDFKYKIFRNKMKKGKEAVPYHMYGHLNITTKQLATLLCICKYTAKVTAWNIGGRGMEC